MIGAGWRAARWPAGDPAPGRDALDAACGDRPVLLWAHDHHTAWLSSAALERLPIGTAPVVERDAAGRPTGVLRETAAWDAAAAVPLRASAGSTSAVRARHARGARPRRDRDPRLPARAGFAAWQRLHTTRAASRCASGRRCPPSGSASIIALGLRSGLGDDWLRIGPVKAFADGTLGSRTASMLRAVRRRGPRRAAAERRGVARRGGPLRRRGPRPRGARDRRCRQPRGARRARGDPGALVAARPAARASSTRQLLHPDDLAALRRARRDRVDAALARAIRPRRWPRRSGATAAAGAYALGSLAAQRSAALLRLRRADRATRPAGRRPGRGRPATGRSPRRSRSSSHSTASGAAPPTPATPSGASGGCCPGYAADLVVLERDPVTCPPDEIAAIPVVATMVGGRWVHGRPPW